MLTAVLCCGNASNGELGLRGVEEDHVTNFTLITHLQCSKSVSDIACGLNHTIVICQNGRVYTCGNNDMGQLGRSNSQRRFEQVESLAAHTIQKVSCGTGFSVALNEPGQLFSWGNNSHSQLGLTCEEETVPLPRIIKSLALKQIIQVACGNNHTLALTNDGEVYSWGRNHHYQLGNGTDRSQNRPQLIKSLSGLPIAQIAAGGNHSFALTFSGALFGWGKNEFGQLGLSDTTDKMVPSLQKTLRTQFVTYVCCGENHSAVLTKDGGVFTCGAGMYGQLGHGSKSNELLPRKVSELMGNVVTQIACGRCHTIVYVPSKRRVYAFGLGGGGQLGIGSASQFNTSPIVVPGPWATSAFSPSDTAKCFGRSGQCNEESFGFSGNCDVVGASPYSENHPDDGDVSFNNCDSPMEVDDDTYCDQESEENLRSDSSLALHKIICGGDHTFVVANYLNPNAENDDQSLDFRRRPSESTITTLDNSVIETALDIPPSDCVPQDLMSYIETVFSSASCLNASFLKSDGSHYNCGFENHGINIDTACSLFHCIEAVQNSSISQLVADCLENNLLPNLGPVLDLEGLRLYVYLPFCHLFNYPQYFLDGIICPFAKVILNLESNLTGCIASWWSKLEVPHFRNIVKVFKKCVVFILEDMASKSHESFTPISKHQLRDCLNLLKILKNINSFCNVLLPYQDFYMPELSDLIDVSMDYVSWLHAPRAQNAMTFLQNAMGKLFFCDYPFLFDAKAKTFILQTDSLLQMRSAMDTAIRRNIAGSVFLPLFPLQQEIQQPYLVLCVSRDNIVLDTIEQLSQQKDEDLKKPLQVVICGEDAVDAGGVKKEFFLLLTREMLDPKYGMFKEYPETNCIWFHTKSFEDAQMFALIGIVCGLAIYNSIIIDLPFPLVLYKKLLKEEIKLEDLKGLSPTIAQSLKELLEYEGDDVEDVFVLCFEITIEVFGEPISYELKPGGRDIFVTKENKSEYVDLYLDFVFNKSVQAPFEAFSNGFHKVCSSRILELFHAQELMALVIGNESYEWEKLEKNAEYKNGYQKDHPAIIMFWKVFHSLDQEDKKKFLLFLTGSDRIPILGMESIKVIIQPMNVDDDYLPVAHTCFNILDLPHYSSEEVLREKLRLAIQHTHGFGLA